MSHGTPEAAGDAPQGELPIHMRVAAVAAEVSRLRHAVVASANERGLAPALRGDIALAVGEACANVVAHAYPNAVTPGPLTLEAYVQDDAFVVVVSDEGTGIAPRSDSAGLGLGLALIARLAQRVEIGSNGLGGAKLRMVFAA
jgi:serine/threonine-protein kinase RsbW